MPRIMPKKRKLSAETTQYDAPLDFHTAPEARLARETARAIDPEGYERSKPIDAGGYLGLLKKATDTPTYKGATRGAKRKFQRQAQGDFAKFRDTI